MLQGFVNMRSVLITIVTSKYFEKRAIGEVTRLLTNILAERQLKNEEVEDNLQNLYQQYSSLPETERFSCLQISVQSRQCFAHVHECFVCELHHINISLSQLQRTNVALW